MVVDYTSVGTAIAAIALLGVVLRYYFRMLTTHKDKNLPPLRGKSWRENPRILTTIEGAAGMMFLKDICRDMERSLHNDQNKTKGSGVIFRLAMPGFAPFIICADYKAARIVLEGDSARDIEESEKSPFVRQFDLFPNRPNVFRYITYNLIFFTSSTCKYSD